MTKVDSYQRQYNSRCVLISSGEKLPVGVSKAARIFTVPLKKGQISLSNIIHAHDNAHLYRGAMYHYIYWLREKLPELTQVLHAKFEEWLAKASQDNMHLRLPTTVVKLYIGFLTAMMYGVEIKAIDSREAGLLTNECWKLLIELQSEQGKRINEKKPAQKFIAKLKQLIYENTGILSPRNSEYDPEVKPPAAFIGWKDQENKFIFFSREELMILCIKVTTGFMITFNMKHQLFGNIIGRITLFHSRIKINKVTMELYG